MLNENLKAHRMSKGLTQEELAIRLNVVRQTVSKWEKGRSVPDADLLIQISDILEVPVSELLGAELDSEKELSDVAEQLSRINEQLAVINRRARRIWRTVGIVFGAIVIVSVFLVILNLVEFNTFPREPAPTPSVTLPTLEYTADSLAITYIGRTMTDVAMKIGEEVKFSASIPARLSGKPVWESSDESIVTVTPESGVVTGISAGEATVTVTVGSETAVCVIRITNERYGLTPEPAQTQSVIYTADSLAITYAGNAFKDLTMKIGERVKLSVTIPDWLDGTPFWEGGNESIFTVTPESGVVTALDLGAAVLTVTVGDETCKCIIRVINERYDEP